MLTTQGWLLGSDPEIQVPNLVTNHLTAGILAYVNTTGRYASGINLFEKLRTRDVEVSSLLARIYIAADEEVRAVSLLHEAVEQLPMDYSLLDVQAGFLKSKGRVDLALECAKRSVTAAPSEFGTWARLAEIYVHMEKWELALLTLNSCPMFTYQDKDAPRMPPPSRVYFPELAESMLDEINDDAVGDVELVHPSLRKFQAAGYKGTFLKAYSLLTEITAKIGWDRLLKIRSEVFVMEEEYRTGIQGQGSRNASTTALKEKSSMSVNGSPADAGEAEAGRSDDEKDGDEDDGESGKEERVAASSTATAQSPEPDSGIEKPEHTVTHEVVTSGGEEVGHAVRSDGLTRLIAQHDAPGGNYTQFQNKRLCERWLDNLIMVLYEDLRVYTLWRSEMARTELARSGGAGGAGAENVQYRKSAEEWEILGELAERLHHPEAALEAYRSCLDMRFSPKAMRGILAAQERTGDGKAMLGPLIRLIAWQYRWYSEVGWAGSPNLGKLTLAVFSVAALHHPQAYRG